MKGFIAITCICALLSLPAMAAPVIHVTPSQNHQPVKASVQDPTPSHFTIDLMSFSNLSVNKKAPTYAIYTTAKLPSTCADFRGQDINYQKPDKYHRVFDFSKRPEVIGALDRYGCVVIYNKPKLPPAKP